MECQKHKKITSSVKSKTFEKEQSFTPLISSHPWSPILETWLGAMHFLQRHNFETRIANQNVAANNSEVVFFPAQMDNKQIKHLTKVLKELIRFFKEGTANQMMPMDDKYIAILQLMLLMLVSVHSFSMTLS